MSVISEIFGFAYANVGPIFDMIFAVIAVASAICAVTRTPADDHLIGRIYRIVEVLALNVGYAKQQPRRPAPGASK